MAGEEMKKERKETEGRNKWMCPFMTLLAMLEKNKCKLDGGNFFFYR